MRYFRFALLTLIFSIACVDTSSGQENKIIVEEVVAIVGNQTVSISELYATTEAIIANRKQHGTASKLQPAEEALESLLTRKLLTAYAKLDSLDKNLPNYVDEEVQRKMDDMVKKAGSMKELERMSGKAVFQLRQDYKKDVTEEILSQMKSNNIRSKASVNYAEVLDFYNTLNLDSLPLMPPQLSYAQIVKMPPATDERKYEVRQQLLEFRDRIMKGEKLSVLARLYSQDYGSKTSGGEYRGRYEEAVAPFSEAIKQLEPGQISEIVETEFGYHLIEVISKTETDFFARHILLKPEFTVDEEARASRELDSIANLVRAQKITFADAAKRHSDDVTTKMNGGLVFNIAAYYQSGRDIREARSRFIYDQINPVDSRHLSSLKVGEVSQPFQNLDQSGNIVYKIVTLLESVPAHKVSLTEDYLIVEQIALQKKELELENAWIDNAIKNIYIHINPQYMNYNLIRDWKAQSEKYVQNIQ